MREGALILLLVGNAATLFTCATTREQASNSSGRPLHKLGSVALSRGRVPDGEQGGEMS